MANSGYPYDQVFDTYIGLIETQSPTENRTEMIDELQKATDENPDRSDFQQLGLCAKTACFMLQDATTEIISRILK